MFSQSPGQIYQKATGTSLSQRDAHGRIYLLETNGASIKVDQGSQLLEGPDTRQDWSPGNIQGIDAEGNLLLLDSNSSDANLSHRDSARFFPVERPPTLSSASMPSPVPSRIPRLPLGSPGKTMRISGLGSCPWVVCNRVSWSGWSSMRLSAASSHSRRNHFAWGGRSIPS